MTNKNCHCDNCDWKGPEEELGCDLANIPHLNERLDEGGELPVGECPKCGALAYRDQYVWGDDAADTKEEMEDIIAKSVVEMLDKLDGVMLGDDFFNIEIKARLVPADGEPAKPEATEAEITNDEERKRGEYLVHLFGLKPIKARDDAGALVWSEPRYQTAHGNKTLLGLYRTVDGIVNRGATSP